MWKRRKRTMIISAILCLPVLFSLTTKNPVGTSVVSPYYEGGLAEFFYDLTYEKNGTTVHEQSILAEELKMIKEAEGFILADLFLYNDTYDKEKDCFPSTTQQLTNALIAKKKARPQMDIVLLTDPMNEFYGSYKEKSLERMRESGIEVVITDLNKLRDSNPLYSGYYRSAIQWFGTGGGGWITNPFDKSAPKINIRSALKLANFKANHRKLLITEKAAFVTSANPHDGSAYHSNVAAKINSAAVQDMIEAERVVAAFSGTVLPEWRFQPEASHGTKGCSQVRYLTEKGILDGLMQSIDEAGMGDTIQIGIFYISDFDLVKGLEKAASRGATVRIVADPNKDAFGIKKDGSPNRIVLSDLVDKNPSIQVRWYDTDGEQYHAKLAHFTFADKEVTILGSGNYTRRNLKGYNLENDVEVVTVRGDVFSAAVADYFDRIWNNRDGDYTVDFPTYEENRVRKRIQYNVQEFTGLSTY